MRQSIKLRPEGNILLLHQRIEKINQKTFDHLKTTKGSNNNKGGEDSAGIHGSDRLRPRKEVFTKPDKKLLMRQVLLRKNLKGKKSIL